MNYEWLFWAEAPAYALTIAAALFVIFSFIAIVASTVCLPDELSERKLASLLDIRRLGVKIFISSMLVLILAAPFSQSFTIYKRVVVYRVINSTLADKTIDTADKFLDVLNKKLDVELEAFKERE